MGDWTSQELQSEINIIRANIAQQIRTFEERFSGVMVESIELERADVRRADNPIAASLLHGCRVVIRMAS